MLTGRPPFAARDPMKLVHDHIAVEPRAPHKVRSEVPVIVSDIVMKLLAKDAQDRYQSAYGLQADLEKCLQTLREDKVLTDFTIGQKDTSDKLGMPQKLYGRKEELEELMDLYRKAARGESQTALIAGYSGIGKSTLASELAREVSKKNGQVVSGKFDPFRRGTPYSALLEAFESLIRDILTENERIVAEWRKKFISVLGENGNVIAELIPQMAHILGWHGKAEKLPPDQASNRFLFAFQRFMQIFATPERPLFIFLDDLQWADRSTLDWFERMRETKHVLLVGAYRDNEISDPPPGGAAKRITLPPLSLEDINTMVSDMLRTVAEVTAPLSAVVRDKAGGNPFFAIEFLHTLHREKVLLFNYEEGRWEWDLKTVKRMQSTENVVEMMAQRIQRLPPSTRQILEIASCAGNLFDLDILRAVCRKSPERVTTLLLDCVSEGLVIPLEGSYKHLLMQENGRPIQGKALFKFVHDRVRQAAYELLAENKKKRTHLKIAWQLH